MTELPDHIYKTYNPKTQQHNGYRVLFQHDNKITSRSFSYRNFDDPLQAALDYREQNLISSKQSNCSTGIIGITKTKFVRKNVEYYTYIATWRPYVNSKQLSKNFTYGSKNLITNIVKYDADVEFRAFRAACHFRFVAQWYKKNNLSDEFLKKLDFYTNLKNWRHLDPEVLFLNNEMDINDDNYIIRG